MSTAPVLFVSHGAPTLALEPGGAGAMLRRLGGAALGNAQALLVVSAHWEAMAATASLAEVPATIHDYGGFPDALRRLHYPAPGAPATARAARALLAAAGIDAATDPDRGLDHGAWVPLRYLAPEARVPVAQLSLVRGGSPELHYRIGLALRPLLAEGVALIGSGSLTHNLYEIRWDAGEGEAAAWVREFADWFAERSEAGDVAALLDYRRRAPHAPRNHPTEEHLLPYFVALGAHGGAPLGRVAGGVCFGVLSMDAFAPVSSATSAARE